MAIIDKPSDYFETILYSGNGGTQSISNLDFQPNWVWLKQRTGTTWHNLYDSQRGATKSVASNAADGEDTRSTGLTAFGSNGFSLGADANVNAGGGSTYVSWNWKAGTAISNNAGSPTGTSLASSGSVNTDAGFSVVTYASNGNNYTVPHGLGVAPNVVIVKNRSITKFWAVYHSSLGNTKSTFLDTAAIADADATYWQNTTPSSTVFSVGTNSGNNSGNAMVAYSFAEKQGYSKFSSYEGNGNANGTFVYTGFKPAFIMNKGSENASSWCITDVENSPFNDGSLEFFKANEPDAQSSRSNYDILSNGFKMRTTDADYNGSGNKYIYLAFAKNPFVTSTDNGSIPATAR
jgi:hypothetical protein